MDYNVPQPTHGLPYTGAPIGVIIAAAAIILIVGLTMSLLTVAGRADDDAGR